MRTRLALAVLALAGLAVILAGALPVAHAYTPGLPWKVAVVPPYAVNVSRASGPGWDIVKWP
jgi:hypothetical protein